MSPWSPWEKNRKITIVSSFYHCISAVMHQSTATESKAAVTDGHTYKLILVFGKEATRRSSVPEKAQDVDIYWINHLKCHNWNRLTGCGQLSPTGSAHAGYRCSSDEDLEFMLSSQSHWHDYTKGANFPNRSIICH